MEFPDILQYAVPLFILFIFIEIAYWWWGGRVKFDSRDSLASLTMGLGNNTINLITASGFIAINYWAYSHRIFDLGYHWWVFVLCFFLEDLTYYWYHRFSHEIRWLWASHVNHHSSQHYNLTTALRQTWSGKFSLNFIFWFPLFWLGFPPEMVIFFSSVSLIYQFWIHTETIGKLGWFEWVFNTPSHHRVHHATNPKYLDSNYAGVLIIWDRLFGSFVEEDLNDKPKYGIVKNLNTFNPIRIAFHEWVNIYKDVKGAKSWRHIFSYLFGAPGWCPKGTRMTSKQIKEQIRI